MLSMKCKSLYVQTGLLIDTISVKIQSTAGRFAASSRVVSPSNCAAKERLLAKACARTHRHHFAADSRLVSHETSSSQHVLYARHPANA